MKQKKHKKTPNRRHTIVQNKDFGICIYMLAFLSDEGSMLETLDYTIRIGSTLTILYFDLYLYSAYAAHYVYMLDVFVRAQ